LFGTEGEHLLFRKELNEEGKTETLPDFEISDNETNDSYGNFSNRVKKYQKLFADEWRCLLEIEKE
jgi:hypothetical protein